MFRFTHLVVAFHAADKWLSLFKLLVDSDHIAKPRLLKNLNLLHLFLARCDPNRFCSLSFLLHLIFFSLPQANFKMLVLRTLMYFLAAELLISIPLIICSPGTDFVCPIVITYTILFYFTINIFPHMEHSLDNKRRKNAPSM